MWKWPFLKYLVNIQAMINKRNFFQVLKWLYVALTELRAVHIQTNKAHDLFNNGNIFKANLILKQQHQIFLNSI